MAKWLLLALAAGAVPLVLALTDAHVADASTALILSIAAAAIAISVIAFQPLLAGRGRIDGHRLIGGVALVRVLVHIGARSSRAPTTRCSRCRPTARRARGWR